MPFSSGPRRVACLKTCSHRCRKRNAFDSKYVPVAFAYGQLAQSGFIGESGRPRTFGITAGVSF